jgi:hypothetical protein
MVFNLKSLQMFSSLTCFFLVYCMLPKNYLQSKIKGKGVLVEWFG